jgi:cell division protease FtsH
MSQNPKNTNQKKPHLPGGWTAIAYGVIAIFLILSVFSYQNDIAVKTITYSEIKKMIRDGSITSAVLEEHSITVVVSDRNASDGAAFRAVIPVQQDPALLPMLEKQKVEITARSPEGSSLLTYILPWVLILGFYLWLQRRMMGGLSGPLGRGGLGGLLKGRFSKPSEQKQRITFVDVAGQEQAKREVSELVDFLREPDRFSRVGATVPHGVLLMGPPGTGKTLLAKALAGEADVPFFSTTGSEFIEVFVGVGASRVRKMFEAARKVAPAIIFIDELDSIGRTRGTGLGGGNDEREQTLNQILAELDGFDGREAVVVLAATNRPDVLDPALLRPGRFDRHVTLNLPDKKERRAILDIHAKGLPLKNIGDLDMVAAGTAGFSGADLKNLLNEAAIGAARRKADEILKFDLEEARDKVIMGTVRTLAIRPEEHNRLAVHEAGHTVAAYYTPEADPLFKVTIIPRGRSLGGTHMLNTEERHTLSEDFLHGQLVTLLAGRASEKLMIGTVSSGADDDIKRATGLARSMVSRWGMDQKIGPVDLRQNEDHPFLGQSIAQPRDHADETAARVDQAVIAMLKNAEAKAIKILSDNKPGLQRLIKKLEVAEMLDIDGIRECLEPVGDVLPSRSASGKKKKTPTLE